MRREREREIIGNLASGVSRHGAAGAAVLPGG